MICIKSIKSTISHFLFNPLKCPNVFSSRIHTLGTSWTMNEPALCYAAFPQTAPLSFLLFPGMPLGCHYSSQIPLFVCTAGIHHKVYRSRYGSAFLVLSNHYKETYIEHTDRHICCQNPIMWVLSLKEYFFHSQWLCIALMGRFNTMSYYA